VATSGALLEWDHGRTKRFMDNSLTECNGRWKEWFWLEEWTTVKVDACISIILLQCTQFYHRYCTKIFLRIGYYLLE